MGWASIKIHPQVAGWVSHRPTDKKRISVGLLSRQEAQETGSPVDPSRKASRPFFKKPWYHFHPLGSTDCNRNSRFLSHSSWKEKIMRGSREKLKRRNFWRRKRFNERKWDTARLALRADFSLSWAGHVCVRAFGCASGITVTFSEGKMEMKHLLHSYKAPSESLAVFMPLSP